MGGFVKLCVYGVMAAAVFMMDVQFIRDNSRRAEQLAQLHGTSVLYNQHHRQMSATSTSYYEPDQNVSLSVPDVDETMNVDDDRPRVAILIAGQCHRFVYRDQTGPLFRAAPDNDTAYPDYIIDVYIALQCGEAVPSFIGTVDAPPYMETLNITDIEQWYLGERGASTVTIQTLETAVVDAAFLDIQHQATTYVRQMDSFNLNDVPCWNAEVRKFFMRHFVFAMSQEVAAAYASSTTNRPYYDAYVFNREDNHYLAPLDLENIFLAKNKTQDEPFVIVDMHCEFNAFSDKMYIANHLGAAMLFSSTKAEFMTWMKRFMMMGLFQKQQWFWRPYQAEAFVHDTLKNIEVEKVDLVRVDLRYHKGVKCVPQQYFYCMSHFTQQSAYAKGLTTCESVW